MWTKIICFFYSVLIFLSMGVGGEGTIKSKSLAQRRNHSSRPKNTLFIQMAARKGLTLSW